MNTSPSLLLFMNIIAFAFVSNLALGLTPTDSSTCSSLQRQCESTQLPSNFHCPLASNCIGLDNGSSAICCPRGEACATIPSIHCDVQLQNPASYPCSAIKTTRLNTKLPRCGQSCCPFGYTCEGSSLCIIDEASAFAASPLLNSSISTSMTFDSSMITPSATDSAASTTPATTISYPSGLTTANSLSGHNPTSTCTAAKCESFPFKAVAAGFFPGAISGALATILALFCLKRPPKNQPPPTQKQLHYFQKSLNRPNLSISSPMASEETSCRTDFLRFNTNSVGMRSKPSPTTEIRMRSPFCPRPKLSRPVATDTVPPSSVKRPQQALQRCGPSTEDVTIYTHPDLLAKDSMGDSMGHSIERGRERDTNFMDMIQSMGFQNSIGEPCFRVFGSPMVGELGNSQAHAWDYRRNA